MKQSLILLTLYMFAYTAFAQEVQMTEVQKSPNQAVLEKAEELPPTSELDLVREAQRSIDRALAILGRATTFVEILVTLLAVILGVTIAGGIFEYTRWREIRKRVETRAAEIEGMLKRTREHERIIQAIRTRVENDQRILPPYATEIGAGRLRGEPEPSQQVKEKLDDVAHRLEFLELLGETLTYEDYTWRGINLHYEHKYELALVAFDKAIQLKPDSAVAWLNKGVVLLDGLGRFEEALTVFDKATELQPDSVLAWQDKGTALFQLRRYDEALSAFERAIGLRPESSTIWAHKAMALSGLDRSKEALIAAERATELGPRSGLAWSVKAIVLARLARHQDAVQASTVATESEPKSDTVLYNVACAYAIMDQKEKALSHLAKPVEIRPLLKKTAKKDLDFEHLWRDPEFSRLVS